MKQLQQFISEEVYDKLIEIKGKRTWSVFYGDIASGDAYKVQPLRTPAPHESQ